MTAVANAASREYGQWVRGINDVGAQDDAANLAGVADALGALCHHKVQPRGLVLQRLLSLPTERANEAARVFNLSDYRSRSRPMAATPGTAGEPPGAFLSAAS